MLMFNCCQCCDARLWSSYAKNLGDCPECEEPDKPLQDLEDDLESIFQSIGVNLMTRQQRIHLAQRARSMAYDAWWQAVCEQVEFSLYDARKAPKIIL